MAPCAHEVAAIIRDERGIIAERRIRVINHVQFERIAEEGSKATYEFRAEGAGPDEVVQGMFDIDLERYRNMEAEGHDEAMNQAIYWLTPIQSDKQYWLGMRVFFRIYKHYLEQGVYIEHQEA